ncbi:MAG: hypothetical protein EBY24_21425 [Betaproteobacteria bacterium]|nr:hypothetical protein [Betaproteobacteria bacterium]
MNFYENLSRGAGVEAQADRGGPELRNWIATSQNFQPIQDWHQTGTGVRPKEKGPSRFRF